MIKIDFTPSFGSICFSCQQVVEEPRFFKIRDDLDLICEHCYNNSPVGDGERFGGILSLVLDKEMFDGWYKLAILSGNEPTKLIGEIMAKYITYAKSLESGMIGVADG